MDLQRVGCSPGLRLAPFCTTALLNSALLLEIKYWYEKWIIHGWGLVPEKLRGNPCREVLLVHWWFCGPSSLCQVQRERCCWEVLVPNTGLGTKLPGPMLQLHHLLAALNVFHLLLQIFLYYSPSVLCSKRLNSMNRSKAPLASGFQFSSGNGEPQWRMQELRRGYPETYPLAPSLMDQYGLIQGPCFLLGGFSIHLSVSGLWQPLPLAFSDPTVAIAP